MRQVAVFGFFVLCFVSTVSSQGGNPWRDDGRCGKLFPLSDDVTPGQCDPLGNGPRKGPCCSSRGFCGNSKKHCNCKTCQDFSKLIGVLYPAEQQKSNPLTKENEWGDIPALFELPEQDSLSFFGPLWDILSEPLNYVMEGWNDNRDELPDKVSTYLEKVATNGAQVFGEFYNETKEQVIQKALAESVDDVTIIMGTFIEKIDNLYKSAESVVYQSGPLSDEEIKLRKERKNLSTIKEQLDDLKEILPLEVEANKRNDSLEEALLSLVTMARNIISLANSEGNLAWSKIKQLEVEFFQVLDLASGTSGEIRQTLQTAFQELNKQLGESSPILQNALEKFTSQWNGTDEAPRST